MNNRQLGLQNIIKSQQSKIAQLKQQLKLVGDISQNRYTDVQKHHMEQLKQKDKIIEFFKAQLVNQRKIKLQQRNLNNTHYIRVKQNVQDEMIKLKEKNQELQTKIRQLQIRLQKNVEEYQIKLKKINNQNKKLNQQASQYIKNKGVILVQIQKITKFYKAAIFQLPKRKETLVWVDNLIKFMEHSQTASTQSHKQLYSFLKNTITQMSKDLINSISQIAIIEQNICKDKDQINENMKKIIEWSSKEQQKIKNEFQQISKIFKNEKQNKQKQELFQCKQSLKALQNKYSAQIQETNKRMKQSQVQKKTLVLAFQQVKNFYQNKQQTYKEQISYLKQTVSDLLDSGRFRQKQFQEEINMLSSQIQSISQRYYQNIEFPIIKVNEKVSAQIQKVKYQFTKFNDNLLFKKTLDKLSQSIPHYIQLINKQAKQNQNIQLYLQKGTQLLTNSMSLVYQASTNRLNKNDLYPDQKQKNQEISQLQRSVRQIQWKQKQSKYLYEINLLKKHNQRLNQLIMNLQKKLKGSKISTDSKDQKSVQNYPYSERKAVSTQAQLESLTKLNKEYQKLFKSQIQKVYKKIQTVKDNKLKNQSVYDSINQSLRKLQVSHLAIIEMIRNQNAQNEQIKKSVNVINDILIKPTEAIESLVRQMSIVATKNPITSPLISQIRKSFVSNIDLNEYKQILTKRQQLGQTSSRTIAELIKTIKDNFNFAKDKQLRKRQIQLGLQRQKEHHKPVKSNTQKKIRQLQSTQNRFRQQIFHGLLKIQKQVQGLQQKYGKKSKINQSKKVETILQQRLKLLMEELNNRQKSQSNQFGQIASNAIKDMEGKLKESIIQNQGLIKELNVLHQLKRI